MMNNPTIDGVLVPRELLSTYIERAKGYDDATLRGELRALLDAQAVERQEPKSSQVPVLRAMAANYRNGHCWDFLDGEAVSKAADEITFLQSTIAQLQARIAELESGRGEPAAWLAQAIGDNGDVYRNVARAASTPLTMRDAKYAWGEGVVSKYEIKIQPLYTAPPAPVSVVADERAEFVNWVRRDWPQAPLSLIRDLLPKDDPHYGEYCDERLQLAWVGWQARARLDATAALNGVKP